MLADGTLIYPEQTRIVSVAPEIDEGNSGQRLFLLHRSFRSESGICRHAGRTNLLKERALSFSFKDKQDLGLRVRIKTGIKVALTPEKKFSSYMQIFEISHNEFG